MNVSPVVAHRDGEVSGLILFFSPPDLSLAGKISHEVPFFPGVYVRVISQYTAAAHYAVNLNSMIGLRGYFKSRFSIYLIVPRSLFFPGVYRYL